MSTPPTVNGRTHQYHAEATSLTGKLNHPLPQEIVPQTHARLPKEGGYLAQHTDKFRLEAVIGFQSAYTHVSGNLDSSKPGHGWATLTTSVVEGLNVLDVVTADRIVCQIGTEHPLEGYTPHVTFLGTRFENLRIAGHPVDLDIDLSLLGARPGDDKPYLSQPDLLKRLAKQRDNIHSHSDLPEEIAKRYAKIPSDTSLESFECSLAHRAKGGFPGRDFGHVIHVPDFGYIHLMVLHIEHKDPKQTTFKLNMLELHMGCIASGMTNIGTGSTNGGSIP